jgi:hypothetical protein
VLQHVSLEIDPGLVRDAVAFWELLGFVEVESPEPLGGYVTWLERKGTQIHLIHTDAASVPQLGHAAVVVEDFDATVAALGNAGHELHPTRELWGAARTFAVGPGDHRVELMAAPPPTSH